MKIIKLGNALNGKSCEIHSRFASKQGEYLSEDKKNCEGTTKFFLSAEARLLVKVNVIFLFRNTPIQIFFSGIEDLTRLPTTLCRYNLVLFTMAWRTLVPLRISICTYNLFFENSTHVPPDLSSVKLGLCVDRLHTFENLFIPAQTCKSSHDYYPVHVLFEVGIMTEIWLALLAFWFPKPNQKHLI
jgi:hypothetical protein